MRTLAILATLVLVGSGCGGDDEPDRPRLPLFADVGGPKLAHPELVFITYAEDFAANPRWLDYSRQLVASSWLDAVGAEYGIGAGSLVAAVVKPGPAPDVIDDVQIVDLVFAGLADGSLPAPTANTLYMFVFPTRTMVTLGGFASCDDFAGYHESARRNGVEVVYAVIARCSDPALPFDDARGTVISHELIEAATDPFPVTNPGWQLRDPASPWLAMGEEVADLCQRGDNSDISQDMISQRSWSNTAAAAEEDPCVPHRYGSTYFNVAADTKTLLRIRPGDHQTVELKGFASKDVEGWSFSAEPSEKDAATLTLGATTLGPNESTTLDIAVPSSSRVGSVVRVYAYSNRGTGSTYQWHFFPLPVIVGEPCASFSGCLACSSHAGCGYCASSGKCESAGAEGSADSSCSAKDFATWPGSCPGFCASHSGSCTGCSSQPGCGWCAGGTPACMEASHDQSHPETETCAYADWSFTPTYCPRPGP
jgi:hypothetical protein